MAENKKNTMETMLATENQQEAADMLAFFKMLNTEQNEKMEYLFKGAKLGFDLANKMKTA